MTQRTPFFFLFLAALASSLQSVEAQDSLTVLPLNPRVGNIITADEREYFRLFPGKEIVDVRIARTEGGNLYSILRVRQKDSLVERRLAMKVSEFEELSSRIMNFEALEARIDSIAYPRPIDRGEQSEVSLSMSAGEIFRGRILFADVHGVALKTDSPDSVAFLSLRSIRVVRVSSSFGKSTWSLMRSGAALAVALYGIPGLIGSETESAVPIIGGLFFTGIGLAVGLVIDLISSPFQLRTLTLDPQISASSLQLIFQPYCRYPYGTRELKLQLAALEKDH